ncbi:hypothetical protein Bca52824_023987 [Brassica carinata]|uniref:Uncharacterized protein n=1 Tax=Brassica carinata TaxID=52824 RepID=A0A8X8ATV5_BRACI|nr:hypothetical protein Bca52824_023987 [Brassica carinata]
MFDPRFKLSLIDYCFTKLDDIPAAHKVAHISEKLELLFKAYYAPDTEAAPTGDNAEDAVALPSQTSPYDKLRWLILVIKMRACLRLRCNAA